MGFPVGDGEAEGPNAEKQSNCTLLTLVSGRKELLLATGVGSPVGGFGGTQSELPPSGETVFPEDFSLCGLVMTLRDSIPASVTWELFWLHSLSQTGFEI